MNTSLSKTNKSLSKNNQILKKTPSRTGLMTKVDMSKVFPSSSNSNTLNSQSRLESKSKEKGSIGPKSTFKLYIGQKKENSSKKLSCNVKSQNKENTSLNTNIDKAKIQKQTKARTLKQVRLAVSKPETPIPSKKTENKITNAESPESTPKTKKITQSIKEQPMQSMAKYIPKPIVDNFKKVSLDDFSILRQTEEEACSNQYLAIHKKLNCLFTIKKFNKNLIIEQQLINQLVESIKIHFYFNEILIGDSIQKLFMIFHDATSVYLVLEPVIAQSMKMGNHNLRTANEQTVNSFKNLLNTLSILHRNKIILRNLSLNSIKNQMGALKITNIIQAATFGKRRRQSFSGCLVQTPHQVIIGQSYDSSYDMWSLGLVFYELILKFSPFEGKFPLEFIKNLQFKLPISLSPEFASLFSSLICEKQKRISCEETLKHSLFLRQSNEAHFVNRDIYNFWNLNDL